MGNTPTKTSPSGSESQQNLNEIFNAISNKKSFIGRNDLKNTWSSQIDKDLYNTVEIYLFTKNQNELSYQTFRQFFLDLGKGNTEQKTAVIFELLGERNKLSGEKLLQFITHVLNSVFIILKTKAPKRFESWNTRTNSLISLESLNAYSQYFLSLTDKTSSDEINEEELRTILIHLDFFLLMVLSRLYETEDKHFYSNVLPKWKYGPVDSGKNLEDISVLDMCRVIFLNYELPFDFQHEWRILFSTSIHGESFSKLSGEIVNKGATIIIVKDKDGYIFGGFAPDSWALGPSFHGDSRSFLFTLYPKMSLCPATNFNGNYQYMNINQQTMPNGLGMGGKLEYFGMWLSAEFGTGYCSESCTTYRNYKMMSNNKEFQISHLEVWGVGSPPPTATELGERSVLDGNLDAKAMLEMAGKSAYSEGLRENVDD